MKTISTQKANRNFFTVIAILVFFLFSFNSNAAPKVYSTLTKNWVNNSWQNYTLDINVYDGELLTQTLSQIWIPEVSAWQNDTKTLMAYNAGKLSEIIFQTWDNANNRWDNTQRYQFSYSSTGKVQTSTVQAWVSSQWQNVSLSINEYDIYDFLIKNINQTWIPETNSWQNSVQFLFTNNSAGFPEIEIMQLWDTTDSSWHNYLRINNTYSATNSVLTSISQTWSESTGQWENIQRITNTYNTADKLVTSTSEIWAGTIWINSTKTTNAYDTGNFLISNLFQTWSFITSAWVNNTQSLYTNNGDGTPSEVLIQDWDLATGIWKNAELITYTYAPLAVTGFTDSSSVAIYPNPVRDMLYFENHTGTMVDRILISDLSGRKLFEEKENSAQVNVEMLPQGIYLIEFISSGNKYRYKFVKK